MKSMRGIN